MAENIELICTELAESVPVSGWNVWVDISQGEPFQPWLTPPGEYVGYNRHTLPLDFVIKLDALNPDEQRLTTDEQAIVAKRFIELWFNKGFTNQIMSVIEDRDSYFYHAKECASMLGIMDDG